MSDPRVVFLRRCLDADEATARAAVGDHWRVDDNGYLLVNDPPDLLGVLYGVPGERHLAHVARHDPAAVLALVEAHRRLLQSLEDHRQWHAEAVGKVHTINPYNELRLFEALGAMELAVSIVLGAYRGRDGWRDEWLED